MEMQSTLTELETRIRTALNADALGDAAALLTRYARLIEERAHEVAHDSDALRELQGRTHQTLEWAAAMVQASRERAAAEIGRLESISSFQEPAEESHLVRQSA